MAEVQGGSEGAVALRLDRQMAEGELPLCIDHWVPMIVRDGQVQRAFPGFVLVRFDVERDAWQPIARTVGVKRLLVNSARPSPLPVGEVEALRARCNAAGIIDDRRHAGPEPSLDGARVRITEGLLAGLEGICTMSTRKRIAVLLSAFDKPIDLPRNQVVPI